MQARLVELLAEAGRPEAARGPVRAGPGAAGRGARASRPARGCAAPAPRSPPREARLCAAVVKRGRPTRSGWSSTSAQCREHRRHRLALQVGVLDRDQPAGPQQPGRRPLHRPHGDQPVLAAPERGRRVVLGHLALHLGPHRDVRRVRGDQVDRPVQVGQQRRVGHVAPVQRDRQAGRGHVAGGPGQRVLLPLDRVHGDARPPRRRWPARSPPSPRTGPRPGRRAAAEPAPSRPAPRSPAGARTRPGRPPGPAGGSRPPRSGAAAAPGPPAARPARRSGRRRRPAAGPAAPAGTGTARARARPAPRRRAGAGHPGRGQRRRRRRQLSGNTQQRFRVGLLQGRDDVVQGAVEHLVEVVRLEADPVVGDPVLREVVRPDPLAAVDRTDLGAAGVGRLLVRLLLGRASSRARSTRRPASRFCSWLFSFCIDTTVPVGRWVMRTAESVVFTLCPPGPDER